MLELLTIFNKWVKSLTTKAKTGEDLWPRQRIAYFITQIDP